MADTERSTNSTQPRPPSGQPLAVRSCESRPQGLTIDAIEVIVHDLFAVGLTLAPLASTSDRGAAERLKQVIEDIDRIIRNIRIAVIDNRPHSALRTPPQENGGAGTLKIDTLAESRSRVTSQETLQMIAEGRLPCRTCGEAHSAIPLYPAYPNKGFSLKDPADGHPYARMSPREFARQVLAGER